MSSWKKYFYFQKGERIAIVTLLLLIAISGTVYIYLNKEKQSDANIKELGQQYKELEVKLSDTNAKKLDNTDINPRKGQQNYTKYEKQIKLQKGETIELNLADTNDLKKIPKIGSSFARRIIKYRDLLGGYIALDQLKEVWGMDDYLYEDIKPYIKIEKNINKLNINQANYKELIRHPYINKDQAKVIVDIRERKGDFLSLEHLGLLEEFSQSDINRLKPYLNFD